MIRFWHIILLVSFISSFIPQSVNAGKINRNKDQNCQILGTILSSKDPNVQGVLCENDQLNVQSRALVSCRYKSLTLWLNAGTHDINRLCRSSRESSRGCLRMPICFRARTKLHLIGQTFASQDVKPRLEWVPVDDAIGYSLSIRSSDGKEVYRKEVTSAEYQFTNALRPGELYQVDISVKGESDFERFAFHILSQKEIDELSVMLETINSGSWPELEKALYRDGAYTRFGLTLEAIENLKQSPELNRSAELQARLGDIYIDAGYFEKAREIFEKLDQTQLNNGKNIQSQLPTSTKFPQ